MGWFWGADDSDKPNSSSEDPLRNLDPELRTFLQRESPVKYTTQSQPTTSPSTSEPSQPQFWRSKAQQATQLPTPSPQLPHPSQEATKTSGETSSTHPDSAEEGAHQVPPQSLFQDGRYAHLWKTYTPLAEIESANKTDNEKVLDILEGYKLRKAEIGRAALENCADEQWVVNECFGSRSVSALTSMCRKENQKLSRCYTTQAKFLKALGYLNSYDRSPEVNERIQMHADKLYHTMIDQEEAIELARKEGRPVPAFPPLLQVPKDPSNEDSSLQTQQQTQTKAQTTQQQQTSTSSDNTTTDQLDLNKITSLPTSTQEKIRKRLEGLNGRRRELEESAIMAELRAGESVLSKLDQAFVEQEKGIKERKEKGQSTLADWMVGFFSPRKGNGGSE